MSPTEQRFYQFLQSYNVVIRFGHKAEGDFSQYKKGQQEDIFVEIVKHAIKGPLFPPDGLGEPLHKDLVGFAKIKPRRLSLRIIYRPIKKDNGTIIMEIIAIGPRDELEVYKMASKRITAFKEEMANREGGGSQP